MTNCYKMLHFVETKPTKPLLLAVIFNFKEIIIYNTVMKLVGIQLCSLGWIPRSGIYFLLLKKCPSQIQL